MSRTPTDGKKQPRLFADDFDGFGPSRFRPADEEPPVRELRGKRPSKLKRAVKKHGPKEPGVVPMPSSAASPWPSHEPEDIVVQNAVPLSPPEVS